MREAKQCRIRKRGFLVINGAGGAGEVFEWWSHKEWSWGKSGPMTFDHEFSIHLDWFGGDDLALRHLVFACSCCCVHILNNDYYYYLYYKTK